jgi:hypothetical protein
MGVFTVTEFTTVVVPTAELIIMEAVLDVGTRGLGETDPMVEVGTEPAEELTTPHSAGVLPFGQHPPATQYSPDRQ